MEIWRIVLAIILGSFVSYFICIKFDEWEYKNKRGLYKNNKSTKCPYCKNYYNIDEGHCCGMAKENK